MSLRIDRATRYKLEVKGDHSYFVGKTGAWVRNERGINNPAPKNLARVIAGERFVTTLGRPSTEDVFVTATEDIAGLSANDLAVRLTIPKSDIFTIIESLTPLQGIATPINSLNSGFIGGGKTLGGAREFVIPNDSIPPNAVIRVVR